METVNTDAIVPPLHLLLWRSSAFSSHQGQETEATFSLKPFCVCTSLTKNPNESKQTNYVWDDEGPDVTLDG